jgi:major membrane immunogen (membrane-anchored lipoprotein)
MKRYSTVAAITAAVLLAACGPRDDGAQHPDGITPTVPPPEPPGIQQPNYPDRPPAQDTTTGPMSDPQRTGGGAGTGTGGAPR